MTIALAVPGASAAGTYTHENTFAADPLASIFVPGEVVSEAWIYRADIGQHGVPTTVTITLQWEGGSDLDLFLPAIDQFASVNTGGEPSIVCPGDDGETAGPGDTETIVANLPGGRYDVYVVLRGLADPGMMLGGEIPYTLTITTTVGSVSASTPVNDVFIWTDAALCRNT